MIIVCPTHYFQIKILLPKKLREPVSTQRLHQKPRVNHTRGHSHSTPDCGGINPTAGHHKPAKSGTCFDTLSQYTPSQLGAERPPTISRLLADSCSSRRWSLKTIWFTVMISFVGPTLLYGFGRFPSCRGYLLGLAKCCFFGGLWNLVFLVLKRDEQYFPWLKGENCVCVFQWLIRNDQSKLSENCYKTDIKRALFLNDNVGQ